ALCARGILVPWRLSAHCMLNLIGRIVCQARAQWSQTMASSLLVLLHGAQPSQPHSFSHDDARAGAQPAASLGDRGEEFLTFSCDGVACAAPLASIREALIATPTIASLPDSPAWFLGVFQLRSEI